jgi:hypothetical protein
LPIPPSVIEWPGLGSIVIVAQSSPRLTVSVSSAETDRVAALPKQVIVT